MKKILDFLYNKRYYFYSLLVAFLILLFTSKNSFLYKLNDWVDANAFFTVGKSMMNGVVPYKDLFEQKGLILYVIYGIGYLLCHKAFYGVFILEVISFSVFLYYAHKIFSLYLNKKYSFILIPVLAYLITTSRAFVHGGSCEEFSLPFFAVSLYYFFKHFKVEKLTNKEMIINGVMAGIVLMMKYTSLGLWMGFGLFIFIDYIKEKDIKRAFLFCLYFLVGMLIPVLLCFIYLGINHAIKDYIECYFTFNMTTYNKASDVTLIDNIIRLIKGSLGSLRNNGKKLMLLILFIPLCVIPIKTNRDKKNNIYFKISLVGLVLITGIVLFWGLRFYKYYLLPIFTFLIITLLGIFIIISKLADKYIDKKYMYIVFCLILGLCTFFSYRHANYREMLNYNKSDYFQFKYADYIAKYKDPTLLNMGFLDGGLYTTTGIIPNTKYFEVQNISYDIYPDNLDDMKYNVVNKNVKFILFYTGNDIEYVKKNFEYIFDNYELVFDDTYIFEHTLNNAFLFKLKGLEEDK